MDTAVVPGILGGLSSIAPTARLERAEYPVVTKIMRSLASLSYPRAMLRLIAPLLVALWLCAGPARADWMNLTGAETAPNIAEITIEDDRVRLVLEIYIGTMSAGIGCLVLGIFFGRTNQTTVETRKLEAAAST